MKPEELIKEIEKRLSSTSVTAKVTNQGIVESVGDGIVIASGLSGAGYGEVVAFEDGSTGFVLNLNEDTVSIVLLSSTQELVEGMIVKATGQILGINVTDAVIGRVVDPLLNPLDGKQLKTTGGKFYPLESTPPLSFI
jgi:F-type H+-transporting ATPase subunit alpha